MRGQIHPWFIILNFESLESMKVLSLTLELKEDVCFTFFLAAPSYKENLNCCVLVIYAVSLLIPLWMNHALDPWFHLCKPGKSEVCLTELPQTLSFWFLFHPWANNEVIFTWPSSGISFCIFWTVVQEDSLSSQPRPAHAERKQGKKDAEVPTSSQALTNLTAILGSVPCKGKNQMNKWIY